MKRIKTFTHAIGSDDYKLPVTPDSDYVVDDSCFVPVSEAVKQLSPGSSFNGENYKQYYDFQDGEDNGMEIPITRTRNGKDIAEISQHIMVKVGEIVDEKLKAEKFEQFKNEVDSKLHSSKPSIPSGSSEATPSS